MAKRRRGDHSLVFKAKVAVAAMQDETGVFGKAAKVTPEPVTDVATLHAEFGGVTLENNFCPVRSARRVFCLAQTGVGFGFDAGDSDGQAVCGLPVRVMTQLKHAHAIEKKTAMSLTVDVRVKRLEACADCPVRHTRQGPSGVLNSKSPAFSLWSIAVSR